MDSIECANNHHLVVASRANLQVRRAIHLEEFVSLLLCAENFLRDFSMIAFTDALSFSA